jgi:hypothetical protein
MTTIRYTLRDAAPLCRWPLDAVRRGDMPAAEARTRVELVIAKCGPRVAAALRRRYLP